MWSVGAGPLQKNTGHVAPTRMLETNIPIPETYPEYSHSISNRDAVRPLTHLSRDLDVPTEESSIGQADCCAWDFDSKQQIRVLQL